MLAYTNIDINSLIQVKGITYSLSELLEDNPIANEYAGGTCLVLRLCPIDYHRLHFIDNGIPEKSNIVKGNYYSVNPTALERVPNLATQVNGIFHLKFGDVILWK